MSPTKALGANNARGEVLVFLDAHSKPETGAIIRLVERVESQDGAAIITPTIAALDADRWHNDPNQVGHGYTVDLYTLECGWQSLDDMRPAGEDAPGLYESPAFIGCAFAISRTLFERLWGFDPHMRSWGVEDIDLAVKCWLMGHRVLHDPEAVVGHRFRTEFSGYSVPGDHVIFNELRFARKAFTDGVWKQWVAGRRGRELGGPDDVPEGLWARAWHLLEQGPETIESERAYLLGHRIRDEFWYAERFGLDWPRLSTPGGVLVAPAASPGPSRGPSQGPSRGPSRGPSKPPTPTVEIQVNNTPAANDDLVVLKCQHPATNPPTVNCQIRLTSAATAPVTVVLTDPTGRLGFPTAATVTLTLPASQAFVAFQITGQKASAAIGDATIQAHVGTATGTVAGTKPVTVVSFTAAKLQLTQGGPYSIVGTMYSVFGQPAVRMTSQATITPAGVDCGVPQLTNVDTGIMQETSAESVKENWNTPTIAWAATTPSGTTVTVPTTQTTTFVLNPALPQPINDGFNGTFPLYDKTNTGTALTRPLGCTGGAVANASDTPGVPFTTTVMQPVRSDANPTGPVVGTVTWTFTNITRTQNFRTFAVVYDSTVTSTTPNGRWCALRQATWSLNLNSTVAGQHATVSAADSAATANPAATLPQANNAQVSTQSTTGSTQFTKP